MYSATCSISVIVRISVPNCKPWQTQNDSEPISVERVSIATAKRIANVRVSDEFEHEFSNSTRADECKLRQFNPRKTKENPLQKKNVPPDVDDQSEMLFADRPRTGVVVLFGAIIANNRILVELINAI